MNWDAIAAIGEITGAAGVVVTLIYLAVQLRQNTKASQTAAIQTSMENSARFSELISTDEVLGNIFWLGLSNPEKLSASEMRSFVSVLNVFLRRESVAYYLYKQGVMPEELWAASVASLTGALNQPGLKVYLESSAESLPQEFREFIQDISTQESTMKEETKRLLQIGEP